MAGNVYEIIDKLACAVRNMLKCLECSICLHTVVNPVRTRCGHSFCHSCISQVLNKKNTSCPLCKMPLNRRSTSADNHMAQCVVKLERLVCAIQADTGSNILLHSKQPVDTKESYSNIHFEEPSTSTAQNTKQPCQETLSRSQQIRKWKQENSLSSGSDTIPLEETDSKPTKLDINGHIIHEKVKTWLRYMPEHEPIESEFTDQETVQSLASIDNTVHLSVSQRRTTSPEDEMNNTDENFSESFRRITRMSTRNRNKRHSSDSTRTKNVPVRRTGVRTRRSLPATNECVENSDLKYPRVHTRIREKELRLSQQQAKQDASETDHQENSSMLKSNNNQEQETESSRASKEDWSRVVNFGKELRPRKGKLRSLNVSIEGVSSNKIPEDALRQNKRKTKTLNSTSRNKTSKNSRTNKFQVPEQDLEKVQQNSDKIESEQTVHENPVNLMPTPVKELNVSNRSEDMDITPPVHPNASFITLDEGKRVELRKLDNNQMSDIIGVSTNLEKQKSKTPNSRSGQDIQGNKAERTPLLNTVEPTNGSNVLHDQISTEPKSNEKSNTTCSIGSNEIRIVATTDPKNKLSLKKIKDNNVTRLSNVKRDLTQQFLTKSPEFENVLENSKVLEVSLDKSIDYPSDKNGQVEINNIEKDHNEVSKENRPINKMKREGSCIVKFQKLGKIFKCKKRFVKFLYLGRTRRQSAIKAVEGTSAAEWRKMSMSIDDSSDSKLDSSRLCNIDNSSRQTSTSASSFLPTVIPCETVNETQKSNTEIHRPLENSDNKSEEKAGAESRAISEKDSNVPANTANKNQCQEGTSRTKTDGDVANKTLPTPSTIYVTLSDNAISKEANQQGRVVLEIPQRKNETEESQAFQLGLCDARMADTSAVKLLPPEEDSQLRFLSNESPLSSQFTKWNNSIGVSKAPEYSTPKKSGNFTDLKSIQQKHSRGLVPESFDDCRRNRDRDANSVERKRKRSNSPVETTDSKRRSQSKENTRDTRSRISLATKNSGPVRPNCKTNNKQPRRSSVPSSKSSDSESESRGTLIINLEDDDLILSSSDSEKIKPSKLIKKLPKKKYQRKITYSNNETDSSDVASVHSRNEYPVRPETEERPLKRINLDTPSRKSRKRPISGNSSDDDVSQIVNNWCNDLNTTQKSIRNAKENEEYPRKSRKSLTRCSFRQSHTSGAVKDTLTADTDMFDSHLSVPDDVHYSTQRKRSEDQKETFEEANERRNNEIIDKVRQVQKINENQQLTRDDIPASSSNAPDNRNKNVQNIITPDNFDDAMANVNSMDFMDYALDSNEIVPGTNEEARKSSQILSKRNSFTSGPEKQNCIVASDVDTKNEEHPEAFGQSNTLDEERNRSAKEAETSVDQEICEMTLLPENPEQNIVQSDRGGNSPWIKKELQDGGNALYPGTSKKTPNKVTSSQVNPTYKSLEYNTDSDSLMNVTRYQIMLQELENDIFSNQKTPQKSAGQKTTECDEMPEVEELTPEKNREAEHSGGEDDIVESTPDTKVKNGTQRGNSGMQGKSTSSNFKNTVDPLSTPKLKNISIRDPSRRMEKSVSASQTMAFTPLIKNVHPLHQSTPKISSAEASNRVSRTLSKLSEKDTIKRSTICVGPTQDVNANKKIRKVCFVCSCLMTDETKCVRELAVLVGGKVLENFTPEVTHVIVKVDEETNTANETLKYLQGIAHRKWVVGFKWVLESLKEQKLVNEEPYEVGDDVQSGPRNSRLSYRLLFEGFAAHCIGPFDNVSAEQYKELLRAAGAKVVETLDALAQEKRKLKVIIVEPDVHDDQTIVGWHQKTGAVPLSQHWLVDCITRYKLASFYRHLQELLPADVLALGYPKELVEVDESDEDDSN